MPTAWRIVSRARAEQAFEGEGARLFGGRWNSPGVSVVYAADSRALAALELLVHLNRSNPSVRFVRFRVDFPAGLVSRPELSRYLESVVTPSIDTRTQIAGDHWLATSKAPIIRVCSSIIPEEYNYLLNPKHPKFSQVSIGPPEPFAFDPRLVEAT